MNLVSDGALGHGESRLGRALGRFYFLRARGSWYVEITRGWVAPAGVAGGLTKYLGAETQWSLVVAIGLPVIVEVTGYLLGRFLFYRGGIAEDYRLSLSRDPYRSESLELFRRLSEDVAALRRDLISQSDRRPKSRHPTL